MAKKFPPGIEAIRPVLNIGEDQIEPLRQVLIGHETEPQDAEQVGNLLRPGRGLQAEIIARGELTRLYRAMGVKRMAKDHVEELVEYLQEELPPFSRKRAVEAPTLPPDLKPLNGSLILSIAGSPEVMQERAFVQGAIGKFYKLKSMPPNVWFPDERVTRVWLARGHTPQQSRMVELLGAALEHDPELLPPITDLGKVDIHTDFN